MCTTLQKSKHVSGGGRIIRDLLNSGARTYFNAVPTDNNFNTAHKCSFQIFAGL